MRFSGLWGEILPRRGPRQLAIVWPRTVHLRVHTARALSAALAGTLLTTTLAALLLTYRLALQFTASVPTRGLARWAYDAAGLLVLPFRPLDTAPPLPSSHALEFPALVALDAFLAAGCLLAFLTSGGLRLARRLGSPIVEVYIDPEAIARDLARFLRRTRAYLDRSLAALGWAWLYGVAYAGTRDWEGLVRRLEEAGRRAHSASERARATARDSVARLAAGLASCGRLAATVRARLPTAIARLEAPAGVMPFRAAARAGYGGAAGRPLSVGGRAATGARPEPSRAHHGISRREFFHRLGAGGAH